MEIEMTDQKSNRDIVLTAINTICDHREAASRTQIVSMTALKMPVVDEQVRVLKEKGLIRMANAGFYVPVDQSPDRPVSTTSLPQGRLKVEVGDDLLNLNPREAFNLAKQLAGLLLAFRSGM